MERVSVKAAPRLANLMVSNPFGFEGQQYLMGAAVELALPLSVLAAGYKLNVTAVTVGQQLQIGFLAMPEAVPGIDKLARHTEKAFEELKAALAPAKKPARRKPAAAQPPRRRTTKV
jgi:hypothetical protein